MRKVMEFAKDPAAEQLHARGLEQAVKQKRYGRAHDSYSQALELLASGETEIDEISILMQSARLLRDDGFVYTRQSVWKNRASAATMLELALGRFDESLKILSGLKGLGPTRYASEAWRFVRSERGATQGLVGRTATVAFIKVIESPVPPLAYYEAAAADLGKGSNRYYDTSNSLHAATQLAIEGRSYGEWLSRARRSAYLAETSDPENYEAAMRDVQRRTAFLRSPADARRSVYVAP